MEEISLFNKFNAINFDKKTAKKDNLTYIPWAAAWEQAKKLCPDASYKVIHYDGKPYIFDENLGYMVFTSVTINGETQDMQLPVMDGKNKAMKHVQYTYTTKYGEKTVEAATMFDINKTIMRCLVKNLALFGLGLYIYLKEELPEFDRNELNYIIKTIEECTTVEGLEKIWIENSWLQTSLNFQKIISLKKQELSKQQ